MKCFFYCDLFPTKVTFIKRIVEFARIRATRSSHIQWFDIEHHPSQLSTLKNVLPQCSTNKSFNLGKKIIRSIDWFEGMFWLVLLENLMALFSFQFLGWLAQYFCNVLIVTHPWSFPTFSNPHHLFTHWCFVNRGTVWHVFCWQRKRD